MGYLKSAKALRHVHRKIKENTNAVKNHYFSFTSLKMIDFKVCQAHL